MNIVIINGSPRGSESNSGYLLSHLKDMIGTDNTFHEFNIKKSSNYDKVFNSISSCEKLIIASPMYTDSIPSHVLHFLKEVEIYLKSKDKRDITVYTIINCAFYEGIQTRLAVKMMKNWCKKAGLTWGQGIGVGAGEMLQQTKNVPIGKGTNKNLGKAFNILTENINKGTGGEDILLSPNFPRIAYLFAANSGWKPMGKANGLTKKDLLRK